MLEFELGDPSPPVITGMVAKNEALARAFGPWVNNEYPKAKNIGDVVVAMTNGTERVEDDSL